MAYEYNASKTYRADTLSNDPNGEQLWWYVEPNNPFDVEKLNPVTGEWERATTKGNESALYTWWGATSPEYQQAYENQQKGIASALDRARLIYPEATGISQRPNLNVLNKYGQQGTELTYLMNAPGVLEQSGLVLPQDVIAEAQNQNSQTSPEAEARRAPNDSIRALSMGAMMAAMIATVFTAGAASPAMGAAEGMGAATTVGVGATEAVGFGGAALGEGITLGASSGVGSGLSFAGADIAGAGFAGADAFGAGLSMNGAYGVGAGLTFQGAGIYAGSEAVNALSPSWWDSFQSLNEQTKPIRQANSAVNTVKKLTADPVSRVPGKPGYSSSFSDYGLAQPGSSFFVPSAAGNSMSAYPSSDVVQPSSTASSPALGLLAVAGLIFYLVK